MLVARTRVFIHVSKLHELPNAWNYAVNNSAGSFQYTPIFSLCHCAQHTMSEVLLITVVFCICCSMLASFGSKHAYDSFLSSSIAWALAAARGSFVSYVGLCCVFCCIPWSSVHVSAKWLAIFQGRGSFLLFQAWSPFVSCWVNYSGKSLLVVWLLSLPLWAISRCFPGSFVCSLACSDCPPSEPRGFSCNFYVWRALVDVLVVSWLQSVGLAYPCDVLRTCSRCLDLAREG